MSLASISFCPMALMQRMFVTDKPYHDNIWHNKQITLGKATLKTYTWNGNQFL